MLAPFAFATVAWNAALAYAAVAPRPRLSRAAACALSPAVCVAYLLLAQLALGGGACFGGDGGVADDDAEAAATVPCALFAALFAQSVVQLGVAGAATRRRRAAPKAAWPCAGVQALTLAYYGLERGGLACAARAAPLGAGLPAVATRPLHLCLWVCSVSAQVLALYCVERDVAEGLGKRARAAAAAVPDGPARRACVAALCCVQAMCWASFAGDHVPGAARAGPAASCAAFYGLLRWGVAAPLGRARAAAEGAGDGALAGRIAHMRTFFVAAWHLFPAVWFAGALGLVSEARVRLGFVGCDVLAKFLPAAIYVSLAVDP
jgi:hypothetical protein